MEAQRRKDAEARKPGIIACLPGVLLLITSMVCPICAAPKPNILLILADDLGYGDLGCYNKQSKIPTPNLDRLTSEGMRFTDAHSPSSVCTPTRYALLTGRYCWRTSLKRGVLNGQSPLLIEPNRPTLASFLKAQGYRTACIGKWHLGLGTTLFTNYSESISPGPNSLGFDYFFGTAASLDMPPYGLIENDHFVTEPTEQIAASKHQREGGNGFWRAGPIAPGFRHVDGLPILTRKAAEFLHRQTQGQPFFLYFALPAPHTPWVPASEFVGKSKAGPYGDFVAQLDDTVGEILASLKESRLAQDTLVIFTSDNGAHWTPGDIRKYGHRANGPLRGQKADIWEGGHRVPFIVRWPDHIKPRTRSDALICLIDIFPTIANLLEQPASTEDGLSFLAALKGAKSARDHLVHHSYDGTFAIRQGSWKLSPALGSHGFSEPQTVEPTANGPLGQLYNLKSDVGETRNLWKKRPELVSRLHALLEACKQPAAN